MAPLWTQLYGAHADIVLNGHDHIYERYKQQDPSQNATTSGIREFVVGTGGESLNGISNPTTNLEAHDSQFGVLVLTLHPSSYDWAFKDRAGTTLDSGTGVPCHGPGSSGSSSVLAPSNTVSPQSLRNAYPRLVFDARPLRSSLTAVKRAGLTVAIHCSQMCDIKLNASLSRGDHLRHIASFYETESEIPGPHSLIHLRLPGRQLGGLMRTRLLLRFDAIDSAGRHRVITRIVRLR